MPTIVPGTTRAVDVTTVVSASGADGKVTVGAAGAAAVVVVEPLPPEDEDPLEGVVVVVVGVVVVVVVGVVVVVVGVGVVVPFDGVTVDTVTTAGVTEAVVAVLPPPEADVPVPVAVELPAAADSVATVVAAAESAAAAVVDVLEDGVLSVSAKPQPPRVKLSATAMHAEAEAEREKNISILSFARHVGDEVHGSYESRFRARSHNGSAVTDRGRMDDSAEFRPPVGGQAVATASGGHCRALGEAPDRPPPNT